MSGNALLFGAGGALGGSIHSTLVKEGFEVFTAGRSPHSGANDRHIQIDYETPIVDTNFEAFPPFEAVVWAQGVNCSDTITDFELEDFQRLWVGNVQFIATSLQALLATGKVGEGSRLAVVSSIWQLESRPGKLSYSVSKAALQGLVKSCALDLGSRGILINAVLPGVVDTPMTRTHLSAEQIEAITSQTALKRLPEPTDIAKAVCFLVAPSNQAITGQFLTVDGGFMGLKHA